MRVALGAAIAAVLLAGCDRGGNSAPVERFEPVTSSVKQPVADAPARTNDAQPEVETSPEPEATPLPPPKDVAVGMTRDTLMAFLGDCAQTIYYVPPDPAGSPMFEEIQPKLGSCAEKYGQRRFELRGGQIAAISAGLDETLAKPKPKPTPPEGGEPL